MGDDVRRAKVVKVVPGDQEDAEQDSAEPRPRKVRNRTPRWVLPLLLALAALPVVGCAGLVVLVQLDRRANPERAAENDRKYAAERVVADKQRAKSEAEAEAASKIFSRLEFNNRVMNCNEEQVIRAVGRPSSTSVVGHWTYWYYRSRTKDGVTGKTDWTATVVFENNFVKNVNY